MPAKARTVHAFRREAGEKAWSVQLSNEGSSFRWERLGLVPRQDLRRIGAFLGTGGSQYDNNDDILRRALVALNHLAIEHPDSLVIIAKDPATGQFTVYDGTSGSTSYFGEPVVPVSQPVAPSAPASAPASVPTGGLLDGAVAELVRVIVADAVNTALANFSPALDHEEIVRIVDEAVNAKVSQPKVTNITLNSAPIVQGSTDLRHSAFENVAKLILAGQATYLYGGAGCGKTTLAKQVADDLGYEFHAETFHAQSTWAKVFGFRDASGNVRETPFVQALGRRSIILCDEFDACPSGVSIGLNSLTANGWVSTDNGVLYKHPECVLLFSGNTTLDGATAQFNSRSTGDLATKDRLFFLPFELDETLETDLTRKIAGDARLADTWLKVVRVARRNVEALGTGGLRSAVTPRASYAGAHLLAQGFDVKFVAEGLIRRGVDARVWDSIRNGVAELAG